MKKLNSIFRCKRGFLTGFVLLLCLVPSGLTGSIPAEEPARSLGERIGEFSTKDVLLSRKAKDAIQKDAQLSSGQIIVTVKNRIATMKGTATSAEQVQRALKSLRAVPGIASVYNECIVAPIDGTADEVAAAVKRAQAQKPVKPEDEIAPPALTGRTNPADEIRQPLFDTQRNVSSKAPMQPAPTTVLFHPDLSAPSSELLTALEKVRNSEARFRELRFAVKNGVVRVAGVVERMSDANDFADQLAKISGVQQVLLSKVTEK